MEHEGSEDRAGYRTGDGHGRDGGGPGAGRSDEGGSRRGAPPLRRPGRFAEAIPYFDRVLERHHRDIEVRLKRGACYVATNQPAKALADFDGVNRFSAWSAQVFNGGFNTNTAGLTLPSTDPYYPDSFGNRGIALLMLGRDQEALDSFQQVGEPVEPAVELSAATRAGVRGRRATRDSGRPITGWARTRRPSRRTTRRSRSTRPTRTRSPVAATS